MLFRSEVSRELGIELAATSIQACLPYAADLGITLNLENHYKDGFWKYPEFAQPMEIFCDLVDAIGEHPNFGVNYDPSNTILAGEDPLEILDRVKHRVVTMHASDRYLKNGTLEDLAREEGVMGYAARLDRKSTRLNSSHVVTSYAVFCLKKKKLRTYYRPQHATSGTR